jgi:transcriptional regulator with XRE-family HTH domain
MHLSELILELKKRRETLNVTQEQLAEIAGVGLRTLKQFESGKGNPTLQTLTKLADALGLIVKLEVKAL